MKSLLGKFLGKKKVPPKEDGFQAAPPESRLESSLAAPVAAPPHTEGEPKYDNEILLRGRIGLSTGMAKAKPEDKAKEDRAKEDKPAEEPTEEPKHDTLESEYSQQLRLKINKEFDESGG